MKDRIWKPLFAIWTDDGWYKSAIRDGIVSFLTWREAEFFRKHNRVKHSTVRALVPFLSWADGAPKTMKDVKSMTDEFIAIKR